MSFDLINTHVVFMELMNRVFKGCLNKFIIVFIDDILVYSKTKKEHELHLNKVLTILREKKLYVKFYKSKFWLQQITFLKQVMLKDRVLVLYKGGSCY